MFKSNKSLGRLWTHILGGAVSGLMAKASFHRLHQREEGVP